MTRNSIQVTRFVTCFETLEMAGALLSSYESINCLSRSLAALVDEHKNSDIRIDSRKLVELRSLEIAADALEILVRALVLDTGFTDIAENITDSQLDEDISKSKAEDKIKDRSDSFNDLVLEHPPIIYKEIVKDDPPITLFRKFLSEFEVKYLIKKAEGLWIPSLTGKAEDLDSLKDLECPMEELTVKKSENRTSWSCVMDVDDAVVKLIIDRVAFVSGYHPDHVERLSLVLHFAA